MSEKPDPEREAARKRDEYERREGLPEQFHEWGLAIKRIRDVPKLPPGPAEQETKS